MIWVTTLDDMAIEERMDEFKKTFPLFTNETISQYRELLPASLLYGTKEKEFIDDCNDEEIQMLHDFFQGCYSFTLFHFIINLVYSPMGPLYCEISKEISKEPRGYYAKNIIRKWTNKIKAQTFQSDRPINKDTDFMGLLKQLPPLERFDFLRP